MSKCRFLLMYLQSLTKTHIHQEFSIKYVILGNHEWIIYYELLANVQITWHKPKLNINSNLHN